MKKPHRRIHFLIWVMLTPLTIGAAYYALSIAPQDQTTELPSFVVGSN